MYEGEDYVLSIYGTKLDPNTPTGQQQKEMRMPRTRRIVSLENEINSLIEHKVFRDGFYIYVHKTNESNLFGEGLEIREAGGGVGSTMARAFDSLSEDIEGDYNYLFNSINEGNQYGNNSIIAVLPRNYMQVIDYSGKTPVIPKKYIMAITADGITYIQFQYKKALEEGSLDVIEPQISVNDIGKRTVPATETADKTVVYETFKRMQKQKYRFEEFK